MRQVTIGKSGLRGYFLALTIVAAGPLPAQTGNQTSATSPYYGSVTAVAPVDEVMPLTLDDLQPASGLENNLALYPSARSAENRQRGQRLEALNGLLPIITLQGQNGVHQYNPAAEDPPRPSCFAVSNSSHAGRDLQFQSQPSPSPRARPQLSEPESGEYSGA